MSLTITVGGAEVDAKSVQVTDTLCEASMARFLATIPSTGSKFVKGQQVAITWDGVSVYGGYVTNIREDDTVPSIIQQDVDCTDQHYLAEKRYASINFVDADAGWVVKYLVDNYLAAEGVTYTATSIRVNGIMPGAGVRPGAGLRPVSTAKLKRAKYDNMKISSIIDEIAKRVSYWWCIDNAKVIWFQPTNAYPLEQSVTVDVLASGPLQYVKNNDRYVNKVVVKNAIFPTEPKEKVFTADGMNRSYVLGYPVNEKPTIVVSGYHVPSDEIGLKGVDSNCDWYYTPGDAIVESNIDAPPIGRGGVVTVKYIGQYLGTVTYTDTAQVTARQLVEGGTGVVEQVVDINGSMSSAEAEQYAKNMVDNYIQDYIRFTFPTLKNYYNPGDYVKFYIPQYGMDGTQLVIEQVSYVPKGSATIYTVTATNIPMRNKWIDAFKNME